MIRPHGVNHAVNYSAKLFNDNRNLRMGRVHTARINRDTRLLAVQFMVTAETYPDRIGRFARRLTIAANSVDFPLPLPPILKWKKKQMLVNRAIAGNWANKTHKARISPLPQKADTFRMMVWSELSAPLTPRMLGTGTGTGNGR